GVLDRFGEVDRVVMRAGHGPAVDGTAQGLRGLAADPPLGDVALKRRGHGCDPGSSQGWGWYFQAPFSIRTITRARWSSPRWSVGDMVKMPCAPGTSLSCSSASRSAARNSGVPGWAFLSATGTAALISTPVSHACAPKVDTVPLP